MQQVLRCGTIWRHYIHLMISLAAIWLVKNFWMIDMSELWIDYPAHWYRQLSILTTIVTPLDKVLLYVFKKIRQNVLIFQAPKEQWLSKVDITNLSIVTFCCSRKLFTFSSLGQYQPNLAQSILEWKGFKFVQMKGSIRFQGEIITK